jgi:hypothetical protein
MLAASRSMSLRGGTSLTAEVGSFASYGMLPG